MFFANTHNEYLDKQTKLFPVHHELWYLLLHQRLILFYTTKLALPAFLSTFLFAIFVLADFVHLLFLRSLLFLCEFHVHTVFPYSFPSFLVSKSVFIIKYIMYSSYHPSIYTLSYYV